MGPWDLLLCNIWFLIGSVSNISTILRIKLYSLLHFLHWQEFFKNILFNLDFSNMICSHFLFLPASGGYILPSILRLGPLSNMIYFHSLWFLCHKNFSLAFSNFPAQPPSFLTSPSTSVLILKLFKTWPLPSPFTESALSDDFLIAKINGLIHSNYPAITGFGNHSFLSGIALLVSMKLCF